MDTKAILLYCYPVESYTASYICSCYALALAHMLLLSGSSLGEKGIRTIRAASPTDGRRDCGAEWLWKVITVASSPASNDQDWPEVEYLHRESESYATDSCTH